MREVAPRSRDMVQESTAGRETVMCRKTLELGGLHGGCATSSVHPPEFKRVWQKSLPAEDTGSLQGTFELSDSTPDSPGGRAKLPMGFVLR